MGTVTIIDAPQKPITLIGARAGICWGADVTDSEKNYRRGLDCIESGHGRTLEFVTVDMLIDGYSARVIREYMRHVGGGLSVLQASTRYIDYRVFGFILPPSIEGNPEAKQRYVSCMDMLHRTAYRLEEIGIPREDVANLLPLGMTTRLIDHKNLRNLIDMSRTRMCNRAYWEFRELFGDICKALSGYSEEWKWISENCFYAKCVEMGYCPEKNGCGRFPKQ